MGKMPVLGIVSAFWVGLALTGCQNCSSCHSDSVKVAKNGTLPSKPETPFSQNGVPTGTAGAGWNNSTATPKSSVAAPVDAPTPVGLEKTEVKAPEALATSKPGPSGVQPASFVRPEPDAPAPTDMNTSRFPPTAASRILPPPPALPAGSSLPALGSDSPFPRQVPESNVMPPPPPPLPPSMPRTLSMDATPLPLGAPPPPPPPSGPNG